VSDPDQPRKLTTILAADVAGYSAHSERDDTAAAAGIARMRVRASAIAAAGGGRIFNTAGDGLMAEFPSASAALDAAAALLLAEDLPPLRIGLHAGDVIVLDNGDLLGHGVNVAARLQQAASAGEALASGEIKHLARRDLAQRLVARGAMQLAKMEETLEAFLLVAPTERAAPAEPVEVMLAVLPFENQSADPDMQFFSDGVSEEILNSASRIAGLRVMGSASSFTFRGANKSRAARELKATHILDGSVRRSEARVRVAAQLLDAKNGVVLWSEHYDRELGDVFALQDEIATFAAAAISAKLAPGQSKPRPIDPKATDLYLRALAIGKTPDQWAQEKAIAYLEAALSIEPVFARARATLALTLCGRLLEATSAAAPPGAFDIARARVRHEAERALAIDPSDAEARYALLAIDPVIGHWRALEAAIEAARALAPNSPLIIDVQSRHYVSVGRVREGFNLRAPLYPVDPLSPRRMVQEAWRRWIMEGDIEGGRTLFNAALEAAPGDEFVWRLSSGFPIAIGDYDAFQAMCSDAVLDRFGMHPILKAYFADQLTLAKDRFSEFPEIEARLDALIRSSPRAAFVTFFGLSAVGRDGLAIDLLERAMTIHSLERIWTQWGIDNPGAVGSSSFFTAPNVSVREHPRFLPLCAKIGLCDYWAETGRWPDFIVDAPNRRDLEASVRALARCE